jgi:hypothetical protein
LHNQSTLFPIDFNKKKEIRISLTKIAEIKGKNRERNKTEHKCFT